MSDWSAFPRHHMVFLIKAVRCGWKQRRKMARRHRTARFFKCGAQQCFPYRGYVTYIWTITRFMRMSDVAVWSIRTPFRQSSGPCVLGHNSIQSIWSWTSAPWSPSRHSLSQSSSSSKPAIIWYILWRSISVWLCTTIGSRRGSLIQDSMRSMMRTFHIRGQGIVLRERRVRVRRNLPSLSCRPRAQVQTV